MKTCSSCNETRPYADFYPNRSTPCKPCARSRDRARYSAESVQARKRRQNYWYTKRYGITLDEYEEMNVRQNCVCAICKSPKSRMRLAVDHEHETGRVRGLLCENCNRAIGMLQDDPQRARALADYLEQV